MSAWWEADKAADDESWFEQDAVADSPVSLEGDKQEPDVSPKGDRTPRRGTMRAVTPYGAGDARVLPPTGAGAGRGRINTAEDFERAAVNQGEITAEQSSKDVLAGVRQVQGLGESLKVFAGSAAWKAANDTLSEFDAIDAGQAPRVPMAGALPNSTVRAYEGSDPETRARMRETFAARLASSQEFVAASTQAMQAYSKQAQELTGRMPEFTDIESVNGFKQWAVRNGLVTSPTMAATMLAAAAGGMPGLLATGGAMAVADLNQARAERAALAYDPSKAATPDRQDDARLRAAGGIPAQVADSGAQTLGLGVPYAALDRLGPAATLARGGARAAAGGVKRLATEISGEAANEGGQEALGVAGDIMAGDRPAEITSADIARVGNAAAVGGLMGAAGHGVNVAGQSVRSFTPADSATAKAGITPVVVPVPGGAGTDAVPDAAGGVPGPDSAGGVLPSVSVGQPGLRPSVAGEPALDVTSPVVPAASPGAAPVARVAGKLPDFGAALARVDEELAYNPDDKVVDDGPAEVWMGRKGQGFASRKDAEQSVPGRKMRAPDLDWRVDEIDGGRFRVAGYKPSESALAIDAAAAASANESSSDAQKEAGNYTKGHYVLSSGLDISIENRKGSIRKSKADAAEPWQVEMPAAYGYIKRTMGADGDHVDIFLGDRGDNDRFWVINQNKADGSGFDEHKIVTGVNSAEEAVELYKKSFSDGFGDKVFASVSGEFNADGIKAQLPAMDKPMPIGSAPTAELPAAQAGQQLTPEETDAALRQVENLRLKRGEAIKLEAVDQPNDIARAVAAAFETPVIMARARGDFTAMNAVALNMPDSPRKRAVVILTDASDAPLALTMHEVLHTMDADVKQALQERVMATVTADQRRAFLETFSGYRGLESSKQDEEIVALLAQRQAKTKEFWAELGDKLGDSDFAKLAKHVLAKLDALIAAFKDSGADYTTDLKAVRAALTDAFAETAKRRAAPAAERTQSGNERTQTENAEFSLRERDFDSVEDRVEVSTTSPRGKKSEASGTEQKWVIDAADIKASETHVKAVAKALADYNTLSGKGDADSLMTELHKVVVENLLWLHDLVPAGVRARAKLWYDGANAIANDWVQKYGISERQAAGVLAVLSPQMDWFKNVSLAERVITTWRNRQNEAWSPAMTRWVESWVGAAKTVDEKAAREKTLADARRLEGTTLGEMSDADSARYVRVFDETYNERRYRLVTPEGGFGDYVTTNDDGDASVTWGGFRTIEKAIAVLNDGGFRNIDAQLGDEHKVRNFYNNIVRPNSADGHVTIDTHAVAAALVKGLSGSSREVSDNFGSAGGNAATGASGTYGLFADAYRDAAEQRGILPREMQSITWEAVRSLFPASIKDQLAPQIDAVWDRFRAGEITRKGARKEVEKLAGGLRPMAWEGGDTGKRSADGGESYRTELDQDPAKRAERTLEPVAAKDQVNVSLSSATRTIPGIAGLYARAQKGDAYAHQLLQDIAVDSLRHLLGGTSAKLKVERATGLYDGSVEPSLGVAITFADTDRKAVLAALAKFGENFNQEQIHVRGGTKFKAGHQFDDGSYATPVWRWGLDKALTRKQIQQIIDKSGLYGLTFGDDFVEAYYVGDPTNEEAINEFQDGAERVNISLGKNGSTARRETARLWAYGRGGGAIGYDRIRGDVAAGPATESDTARRVAEYLNRVGDEPGRVKAFAQAQEVTPAQRDLQERIARAYEALPDNDLRNPRVKRAYNELAKEVKRQYEAMPIRVEVFTGTGEPYKSSAAMRRDVLDNNHLFIFATTPETFGPEGADFAGHPLLESSGLTDSNGTPLLMNDLLRAVHDYFAHNISETQFGPKGEEAAWKNHMASTANPWARWALTSETRGQNSWVNFNPAAAGVAVKDRPFARQKAALLPVEYSLTGDRVVDAPMKQMIAALPVKQRSGSLVSDEMFSEKPGEEYAREKDKFGRKFIATDPSKKPGFKASDLRHESVKTDKAVDALTYAVDSEYPIINAVRKAASQTGENWKMAVEALPGRTADAIKQEIEKTIDPFLSAFAAEARRMDIQAGQLTDAYGVYRLALHAAERNATLRAQGSKKQNPSGMSEAEAKQWLDFFNSEPEIKAAFNKFDPLLVNMQKRTDEIKLKAGLLTQDEIDARSAWDHYINLQGDPGMDDVGGRRPGSGWNDDTDKSAQGRDSLSANPIVNTVRVLENAVRLAELSRVKAATYEFAKAHPDVIGAKIKRIVRRPVYDDNGNFTTAVPNVDKFSRDAVVYRQGPVEFHIEIGDTRVVEALKRLNGYKLDPVARVIGRLTSALGRLYTQFSPHFPLVNAIRDMQQQMTTILGNEWVGANGKPISSASIAWRVVSRYPMTFSAALQEVWGRKAGGRYRKFARELVANGGTTGLTRIFTDEEQLMDFITEVRMKAGQANTRLAWSKFVDTVSGISEVFELTGRVSVYSTLRDLGMPVNQAANVTKNLMNFNKAGTGTRGWAGNLYMFLRPSVQDVYKTSGMLRTKKGAMLFAAMYAGAVMLYGMLREMSGDDEEDPRLKNMDKRNASERRSYYILPTGGEEPARIPVGFGLTRLAWGLATVTVDSIYNPDFDTADAVDGVFKSAGSSLSPMQISDINVIKDPFAFALTTVAPTLLVTPAEIAMNKTKGGYAIRSDNQFDSRPPHARGFANTPQEWKEASQWLSDASDGKIQVAPETLQYVMRSYGGGPASTMVNALHSREKLRQGEELTLRDVPVVQAFVGPKERYVEREFRELTNEARRIKGDLDDALLRGSPRGEKMLSDERAMLAFGFKDSIDDLSRQEAKVKSELRKLQITDYSEGARQMKSVEAEFRAAKQELLNAYNQAKSSLR
jgi:hypothetical protein